MESARHRRRLTASRIKALAPRAGEQYVVWDPTLTGFGVRVSPANAKTFILKYRLASGRVRWKSYGRFGTVALEQARKRAQEDIGTVASGEDPLLQRDTARDALTLGAVADLFLSEHAEVRTKPATLRLYKLAIDGHLRPRLGAVPILDVTAQDMLKLHYALRATPYLANRVRAVASKLMNWAAAHGYRGQGPHVNPADGVEKYPEDKRKRYLSVAEFARLGAALRVAERRGSIAPSAVAAIKLLCFTGARVGEILGLRRDAVKLDTGRLELADSKTGAKTIILNAPAIDVLKALPVFKGSPYVFPGEGHGKRRGEHRVDLNSPWAWVKKRARLRDVRLHDLRHSFASVAVAGGQSLPMIGALLGHSQPATTDRYAHLADDPLRAASSATAATIDAALSRRRR